MEEFVETGSSLIGKEKITEILNRRHKEREVQIQAAKLERQKDCESTEALQYFEASFDEKVKFIRNSLETIHLAESKTQIFANTQNDIYDLQRYLSSSTFFLNEYRIKICQNTISELNKTLETLKSELLPKKKFGFKSKKIVKMIAEKDKIGPVAANIIGDKKDDLMNWTFSNKSKQCIALSRADTDDQTITASRLSDCIVILEGHPGSLQFAQLENCLIICGPTSRSIFLDDCVSCRFVVACQQLRCHRSRGCDMYLNVTSRAIIEDCKEIRVAKYNYSYDRIEDDYRRSGLDLTCNNWDELDDFNWLSTDKPSPNWSLLNAPDVVTDWTGYIARFKQKHFCNNNE